jgi:hypothetical protein
MEDRFAIDVRLMYSAQDEENELITGDGNVVDLSKTGLRIHGSVAVKAGFDVTLFLYLPDGRDPLFVLSARVTWSRGHVFGVEILKMNVRERNRLRYFLGTNFPR